MKIYPFKVRDKAKVMQANINNTDTSIRLTGAALENLQADLTDILKGAAWGSVNRYNNAIIRPLFKAYRLWKSEYLSALKSFEMKANALPNISYIDRELFESYITDWEERIDREYSREHVRYSIIRLYRRLIARYRKYIDAMERFATGTENIFEESRRLEGIILKANTELSAVKFDTAAGTIDFTGVGRDWQHELHVEGGRYYLLTEGFTTEEIGELERLGFEPSELSKIYAAVKECGEEKFVINLSRKDFDAAFSKEVPEGAATQMFIAEYLLRVSMKDGDKELARAINAMLKPEAAPHDPKYHMYQDIYTVSNMKARNYMDMLYTCTGTILDNESVLLFCRDEITEDAYSQLVERNAGLMALTTVYGSMYELIGDALNSGYGSLNTAMQLPKLCVSDFSYDKELKEYAYTLKYDRQSIGANHSGVVLGEIASTEIPVKTDILRNPSDVAAQMNLEAYQVLIEKKQRLKEMMVKEMAAAPFLEGIIALNPFWGSVVNAVYETAQGNYGDAVYYGRESEFYWSRNNGAADDKNIYGKPEMKSLQRAASKALNYISRIQEINSQMREREKETTAKWFYSGGTYMANGERRLVLAGIYDPTVIERIVKWSEKGMEGLIMEYQGIDDIMELYESEGDQKGDREKNKEKFEKSIKVDYKEDYNIMLDIWNGDGDILDIDIMDFERGVLNLKSSYEQMFKAELPSVEIILNNPRGNQ